MSSVSGPIPEPEECETMPRKVRVGDRIKVGIVWQGLGKPPLDLFGKVVALHGEHSATCEFIPAGHDEYKYIVVALDRGMPRKEGGKP